MPAGRPTSYQSQYADQARKLCELGATDWDLAQFFEVTTSTIWRWSQANEEFCSALKAGKEAADERVARSLYHKAIGYSREAVKIMQYEGGVIEAPYVEHTAPDTTAAIFWLKNRRPKEWRDKTDVEMTGKDGGPIQTEDVGAKEIARRMAFALAAGLNDDRDNTA